MFKRQLSLLRTIRSPSKNNKKKSQSESPNNGILGWVSIVVSLLSGIAILPLLVASNRHREEMVDLSNSAREGCCNNNLPPPNPTLKEQPLLQRAEDQSSLLSLPRGVGLATTSSNNNHTTTTTNETSYLNRFNMSSPTGIRSTYNRTLYCSSNVLAGIQTTAYNNYNREVWSSPLPIWISCSTGTVDCENTRRCGWRGSQTDTSSSVRVCGSPFQSHGTAATTTLPFDTIEFRIETSSQAQQCDDPYRLQALMHSRYSSECGAGIVRQVSSVGAHNCTGNTRCNHGTCISKNHSHWQQYRSFLERRSNSTHCQVRSYERAAIMNGPIATTTHDVLTELSNGTAAAGSEISVASSSMTNEQRNVEQDSSARASKTSLSTTVASIDYASKSAGALVLEKSESFQGTSNLLNSDKDKYAIVPCEEPEKLVVIGLSEDILVKQVVIANYERYSSHIKDFRIHGSTTMGDWVDLGTFATEQGKKGKQEFDLAKPLWARYLKFEFLTHYGNEYYCTISQIRVHGSTVLQGFHEQWSQQNGDDDKSEEGSVLGNKIQNETTGKTQSLRSINDSQQSILRAKSFCFADPDFEKKKLDHSQLTNELKYEEDSTCLARISLRIASRKHTKDNRYTLEPISSKRQIRCGINRNRCASTIFETECEKQIDFHARTSDTSSIPGLHERKQWESVLASLDRKLECGMKTLINGSVVRRGVCKDAGPKMKSSNSVSHGKIEEASLKAERLPTERDENILEAAIDPKSSNSAAGIKQSRDDASERNSLIEKFIERFPSAACLAQLELTAIKTKVNTGGAAGMPSSGIPMEPIFKKLTDEIKSLQASVIAHDLYARESTLCYQSILLEILLDSEKNRLDYDHRISRLENFSVLITSYYDDAVLFLVDFFRATYCWTCDTVYMLFAKIRTFIFMLCEQMLHVVKRIRGRLECGDAEEHLRSIIKFHCISDEILVHVRSLKKATLLWACTQLCASLNPNCTAVTQ